MPITNIEEIQNAAIKPAKPIKEVMDINVAGIPEGISRRNGMIYILCGSGGSGKSSLALGLFKKGQPYHKKFHNVYYFVPSASFNSVENHPFARHDKVFHEMTAEGLMELHDTLLEKKNKNVEDEEEPEYNLVFIDDFASSLKDKDILKALNKMLIKARHLNTGFIFTLQSYLYFPKILRKQVTYATIFRPRTRAEWQSITDEILQMEEKDSKKIFDYVFDAPYTHLDCDCFDGVHHKNFNRLAITNSDDL